MSEDKSQVTEKQEEKKLSPEEKEKLDKAKLYYSELRRGQAFLDFMVKNIMKSRNRNMRRRVMKELAQGKICREAIRIYATRIDEILVDIDKRLEAPVEEPKEEENV